MTKTERFKIQTLLQMAKITDSSAKKSEYLDLIENLLYESPVFISSNENPDEDFFTIYDPTGKMVTDCYNDYLSFCNENGIKAGSKNYFGRFVKEHFDVESVPKTINGKTVRVYEKVKYK